MRGNQTAQRRAIATGLRNLPRSAGGMEKRLDLAPQLDRLLLVAQTGERGRPLRIAREFVTHVVHPRRIGRRIEEEALVERADQSVKVFNGQQVAEALGKRR